MARSECCCSCSRPKLRRGTGRHMAPLAIAAILDWSLSLPTRSPLIPSIRDNSWVQDRLNYRSESLRMSVVRGSHAITPSFHWAILGALPRPSWQ